jgi:membrane associated rhomboid family serine protease
MIPLRDANRARTAPFVNYAIIGVNILVFLFELSLGKELNQFVFTYGLVPARLSAPEILSHFSPEQLVLPFVSFMFLHGGFLHLLGNMWSLFIFGDNVEDRVGHGRYLLFFLLCGWASGLSHVFMNWHSQVPTIGASGAIAGVIGAYFILFPNARILGLVPIFFFFAVLELPAVVFIGMWFLFQFLSATGTRATGIAWWAHIGGFIFGIILLKTVFSRRR